jgi:hypothetical protein
MEPTFLEEINSCIVAYIDVIHDNKQIIEWYDAGCPDTSPTNRPVDIQFVNICRMKSYMTGLLVDELRKARDNGNALLLHTYSRGKDWKEATPDEQQRMETCWINLSLLTLKLGNRVLYVRADSPVDWKNRTRRWIEQYNLEL